MQLLLEETFICMFKSITASFLYTTCTKIRTTRARPVIDDINYPYYQHLQLSNLEVRKILFIDSYELENTLPP